MNDSRNLTLMTDLYELTMMQGYFRSGNDSVVVFDAFYRKNPNDGGYAIACGLEQIIEYIKKLSFSYRSEEHTSETPVSAATSIRFRRAQLYSRANLSLR